MEWFGLVQNVMSLEKEKLEDDKANLQKEILALSQKHALESKQQARDFDKKWGAFVEKVDKVRLHTASALFYLRPTG